MDEVELQVHLGRWDWSKWEEFRKGKRPVWAKFRSWSTFSISGQWAYSVAQWKLSLVMGAESTGLRWNMNDPNAIIASPMLHLTIHFLKTMLTNLTHELWVW
jgi:hypothetical protein